MSHNVFANMWQIAGKAGMNKSISRFPDVCLSPPAPPAGPIPVPYPDTSFSSDLKNGSKSVKLGGKPAALAQQSFYKVSLLGNEAATRSFGASVITHQITGKTYFQAWSMDVKFEGKNVCRHIDITTSNHMSNPPGTPPAPSAETQTLADAEQAIKDGKCPCCGSDLHDWQKDESGKAFEPIKEEDFWKKRIDSLPDGDKKTRLTNNLLTPMLAAKDASRAAKKKGDPSCPNVHDNPESGCALYLNVPPDAKVKYKSGTTGDITEMSPAKAAKKHWAFKDKRAAQQAWKAALGDKADELMPASTTLNHKTPNMAGGCNNPHNTTPDTVVKQNETCRNIENWQYKLEQEFKPTS